MENSPNNPDAPVTSAVLNAVLKAEFGKFEERLDKKLDRLLSDQANVILGAVDELVEKKMDKKLSDKFDPVITKLDAVLKEFQDHRDEDIAGAEQLRRHDDQLKKHETLIGKLESARA
jgi:hypothetical protein